jgi:protein ImuB
VNGRRERLWLALRFPDLPLFALNPDLPQALSPPPVVVAEKHRVVYATEAATAGGVTVGMDITTAQLLSNCQILARDPNAEKAALDRLCEQLYRFTPHIDRHQSRHTAQGGVLLEISSCLRLFGGAKNLCQAALDFLDSIGMRTAWALAHTAKGAWLLSLGPPQHITGDDNTDLFIQRLNHLPIQVLTDYPDAVDALEKMGFTDLGDIALQIRAQSVASFTKRLGREFASTLQEIYGIDQGFNQASLFTKPVDTYVPDELFLEEVQFDYPAVQVDHLKPAIEDLLQQLADFLRTRQLECQHIQWRMTDIHRREAFIQVYSDTGQTDWQLFYDLSLIQFENTPLPFEVDCLELGCNTMEAHRGSNRDLDLTGEGKRRHASQELAITMARLKARIGDNAIHKVSYRDSPLPELSQAIVRLADKCQQELPKEHRQSLRPFWLFIQPHPVEQRREQLYWRGYLKLAVGPERIIGHWWNESVARDYYLARRRDNVPVWAFQDLYSKKWYVHGVFA